MSLLDKDAEPTLQVSPGALLSDEPRAKETKKERRKGGGLSIGRTKPRDAGTEKASKKGRHARNKSGSRTPPDSPRADRMARGGRNQPSPNVKGHRKRYSQLGLDLSAEESEGEEAEYFANQAASEVVEASNQEPFFSIDKDTVTDQPTSPGPRSTVHFPVQFEDPALFPSAAFEPQPAAPQPTADEIAQSPTKPLFPPLPQSDTGPWGATASDTPAPLSDVSPEPAEQELLPNKIPDGEWRISPELKTKCHKQFVELQPTGGLLQGNQARTFFIQSRLPNADLSAIWRLADMNRDNALSEQEFCVAMKLVLLRRKGYRLPVALPLTLKESLAADSSRKIAPLQSSQTVPELLGAEQHSHPPLSEFLQHSQPELHQPSALLVDLAESSPTSSLKASDSLTAVEREEPTVATIISLEGEERDEKEQQKPLYHSFTESSTEQSSSHTSVRRARKLKHFTPPPENAAQSSPPHSPFSPSASSETEPIITVQSTTPKVNVRTSKDKAGYQILPAGDDETASEDIEAEQLAIGRDRGHGRSTSLDLKKMIAGSDVSRDMPAAEPPRPPPKPVTEDSDLLPQVRGRSASTGSISSTGATAPVIDTSTSALLLSSTSRPVPTRKAPLLPPVPKPRRPPPPQREEKPDNSSSLLRNKSELQTTIRSLKDTNATLQALNRELEEKLFGLMEDRVQLAREVELARQMKTSA